MQTNLERDRREKKGPFSTFSPSSFSEDYLGELRDAKKLGRNNTYNNNKDLEVAHPQSGSSSTRFLIELEFVNVGF